MYISNRLYAVCNHFNKNTQLDNIYGNFFLRITGSRYDNNVVPTILKVYCTACRYCETITLLKKEVLKGNDKRKSYDMNDKRDEFASRH